VLQDGLWVQHTSRQLALGLFLLFYSHGEPPLSFCVVGVLFELAAKRVSLHPLLFLLLEQVRRVLDILTILPLLLFILLHALDSLNEPVVSVCDRLGSLHRQEFRPGLRRTKVVGVFIIDRRSEGLFELLPLCMRNIMLCHAVAHLAGLVSHRLLLRLLLFLQAARGDLYWRTHHYHLRVNNRLLLQFKWILIRIVVEGVLDVNTVGGVCQSYASFSYNILRLFLVPRVDFSEIRKLSSLATRLIDRAAVFPYFLRDTLVFSLRGKFVLS